MTLERIPDHAERGAELLLEQFQGKPRIAAIQRSHLRQVQVLEDVVYDVILARLIDNATGPRLDTIGRVVGEPRRGRDDTTYKKYIRARIRINRSEGSTKDVLDVLEIVSTATLIYNEYQPAALYFELLDIPEDDPVLVYRLLFDTKAAGVKLSMVVPTALVVARFLPRSWNDVTDTPGNACGDANVTRASLTSAAQPYALVDGRTLTFKVDGGAVITVTFRAADFVSIGAATAAEVRAVLARDVPGYLRRSGTTSVTIATHRFGTTATLEVTGGTANGVLGFSTTPVAGTGDTTFGLLSDAVTVRDPAASPAPPRPVAPTIEYVTPNTGSDEGGTAITIHGSGFATSAEVDPIVRLHPTTSAPTNVDDIVVVSDSVITCKTRPRDPLLPRRLKLWITTPYGTGSRSAAFRYALPPALGIASVSPGFGQVGATVVITGSRFTDVDHVGVELFGDYVEMASFVVDSDNQITAVMPGGVTLYAPYGVRVSTPTDTFLYRMGVFPPAFTFFGPPTFSIDSFVQEGTSIMGGYQMHLVGQMLDLVIDISYDALTSIPGFTIVDPEHIDYTAPDADSMFHDLSDGEADDVEVWLYRTPSPELSFFVRYDPLAITAISPSETPDTGGETITLTGTSLDATEPYNAVGPTSGLMVDGVPTDFTVVDEHTLEFVAPAGTAGTSVTVELTGIVGVNSGVPVGTSATSLSYAA